MTLDELAQETLVQKHRRLRQEKCDHDEVYSSTVMGPSGTFTNSYCLECGKLENFVVDVGDELHQILGEALAALPLHEVDKP